MAAILAAVMRIVSIVTDMQSALGWIRNLLARGGAPVAEGSLLQELFTTYQVTIADSALLANGSYGLSALADLIAIARADILAAIAALPAGSAIVIPPASDNSDAVWSHVLNALSSQYPGLLADTALSVAFDAANQLAQTTQLAAQGPPGFVVDNRRNIGISSMGPFIWPTPDYATMSSYSTALAWLNATDTSGRTWAIDGDTGQPTSYDHPSDSFQYYSIAWVGTFVGSSVASGAPIWPGLAGVTLGTPVALADALTVTGPLQGVLVECATAPAGASSYILGALNSYYRWGSVSFVSDNGDAEEFQWLGFGLGIYLPKAMAEAASAIFRVQRLPTATVTPFTIP
jgi:hypothetical protein